MADTGSDGGTIPIHQTEYQLTYPKYLQGDDVEKHNEQYPGLTLHKYTKAHDRFLIIDEDVYHIGA